MGRCTKEVATYFVNCDCIEMNETTLKQMATLYRHGARLVGFTARDGASKAELNAQAEELGFVYLDIVCGVSCSSIKHVIGSDTKLASARYDV